MALRSAGGAALSDTDAEALARSAGAPLLVIARRDLHRLLAAGLDPPRLATVASVDDDGVTLDGGERITAPATFGADGLGSVARRHVAPESRILEAGYTVVRAVADYRLGDGAAFEAWGRGELVGAAALPGGRTYWFYEAPTGRVDGDDPLAGLDAVRWPDPIPALIAGTDPDVLLVTAIRTVRRCGPGIAVTSPCLATQPARWSRTSIKAPLKRSRTRPRCSVRYAPTTTSPRRCALTRTRAADAQR